MEIPLEDTFADVIGKAQRGLLLSDSTLADKSGVGAETIRALRDGKINDEALRKVVPVLQLNARALLDIAHESWKPEEIDPHPGLAQFNTKYHDITVNAYLVWDDASREAVAFDTGANCHEMLERARREELKISLILLTHAHPDHVADLDHLKKETGAPVFISKREPLQGAELIDEGKTFQVGRLKIEARSTWGHSPGGMTFVVSGLDRLIAVVGDSIFAGSMGGGNVSYSNALENNREKILTLADDTIICPGHGPMTTVAQEKRHNAFFAREES